MSFSILTFALITSVEALSDACSDYDNGSEFAVTAVVSQVTMDGERTACVITDGRRWAYLNENPELPEGEGELLNMLEPGARCAFYGKTKSARPGYSHAYISRAELLESGARPVEPCLRLAEFADRTYNFANAYLIGTLVDVFPDDIDDKYEYFILKDGKTEILASHRIVSENAADLTALIGARLKIRGFIVPHIGALRAGIGRLFTFSGRKNAVEILEPPPKDPFDADWRVRKMGEVLSVWQGKCAILRNVYGNNVFRVDFATNPIPEVGDFIEVAGRETTDLIHDNVERAMWRKVEPWNVKKREVESISAERIFDYYDEGYHGIDIKCYGKLVRMEGEVIANAGDMGIITLNSGKYNINVDISTCPQTLQYFEKDAKVAVTGTVLLEIANWSGAGAFPLVHGVTIIVNNADAIEVIKRAPWLKVWHVIAVSAIVILIVLLIVFRERAKKRQAQSRTQERTRLAAELHDGVSQNLSGVAMQLDAAVRLMDEDRKVADKLLSAASQTLLSSRQELRNCLWDLRNHALDEPTFDAAIKTTLKPFTTASAEVQIRFQVPRARVPDDTAHAILRIVRELTSNAIRHGKATKVRVAGAVERGSILFSVNDNGAGFDPKTAPGTAEGHFGLQGVRERLKKLGGKMIVDSRPDRGTIIRIVISAI